MATQLIIKHLQINTYSMRTYVLLHFQHKNYVTIKNDAACRNTSQVVKLKIHLLQHLLVLQSWYNVTADAK